MVFMLIWYFYVHLVFLFPFGIFTSIWYYNVHMVILPHCFLRPFGIITSIWHYYVHLVVLLPFGVSCCTKKKVMLQASPLHLCCQWGLEEVVRTLLEHGASLNAKVFTLT
jgi:hypothetical protein